MGNVVAVVKLNPNRLPSHRSVVWFIKNSFFHFIPFWCDCKKKYSFRFMVFNTTFNNISFISWRSVFLVEETGLTGEHHRPVTSHWQTLSHTVVYKVCATWQTNGNRQQATKKAIRNDYLFSLVSNVVYTSQVTLCVFIHWQSLKQEKLKKILWCERCYSSSMD